jgi:hypothetical protein
MTFGEITEKLDDSFVPKNTASASLNPLPVMMTVPPPPADTVSGESDVTAGPPGVCVVELGSELEVEDVGVCETASPTRRACTMEVGREATADDI